jgi:hypothetical protein
MFAELILQRLDMLSALVRRSQTFATQARFVPIAFPAAYRPAH